MSTRRFLSIILIMLANFFILAHAVVPHHHHDGIVCLSTNKQVSCDVIHIYGENEECCCVHDNDEVSHHGHTDECDLQQTVRRDGNISSDLPYILPFHLQVTICNLSCHNHDFLIMQEIEVDRYEQYKPYLQKYINPYVGSTLELRGPPASIIS